MGPIPPRSEARGILRAQRGGACLKVVLTSVRASAVSSAIVYCPTTQATASTPAINKGIISQRFGEPGGRRRRSNHQRNCRRRRRRLLGGGTSAPKLGGPRHSLRHDSPAVPGVSTSGLTAFSHRHTFAWCERAAPPPVSRLSQRRGGAHSSAWLARAAQASDHRTPAVLLPSLRRKILRSTDDAVN